MYIFYVLGISGVDKIGGCLSFSSNGLEKGGLFPSFVSLFYVDLLNLGEWNTFGSVFFLLGGKIISW